MLVWPVSGLWATSTIPTSSPGETAHRTYGRFNCGTLLVIIKVDTYTPNSPKLPQHFPTPPVARAPNMDWNSPAVLSLVLEGPHFPAHFLSRHSLQGPVDCLSLSHSVESSSARQHASKRESKSSPVVRWLVRSSFVH